jgi:hypothetical protein
LVTVTGNLIVFDKKLKFIIIVNIIINIYNNKNMDILSQSIKILKDDEKIHISLIKLIKENIKILVIKKVDIDKILQTIRTIESKKDYENIKQILIIKKKDYDYDIQILENDLNDYNKSLELIKKTLISKNKIFEKIKIWKNDRINNIY